MNLTDTSSATTAVPPTRSSNGSPIGSGEGWVGLLPQASVLTRTSAMPGIVLTVVLNAEHEAQFGLALGAGESSPALELTANKSPPLYLPS